MGQHRRPSPSNTWRSHALTSYAHEYAHPAGTVRIITDGDRLRWRGLGLPMEHRHSDVFDLVAEPAAWPGNKTVQLISTDEGDIESLKVPLEPAVAPIVFRRLP